MDTEQDTQHPAAVVWHLLIDRWHTTLRAKALSRETVRGYLFTARRKWHRKGRTSPPTMSVVK